MKKSHLPKKICKTCGFQFSWRKKWRLNWENVLYCSENVGEIRGVNENFFLQDIHLNLPHYFYFAQISYNQNFEYFENDKLINPDFEYKDYKAANSDIIISRKQYFNQLYGFWLGQCIGN